MQMKYRTRIYYTEEQKTVMWDRWQKGDSFHAIARLFDRNHSSIAGILARTGVIISLDTQDRPVFVPYTVYYYRCGTGAYCADSF